MNMLFAVLLILFGFMLILADILFIPGGIVAALGGVLILSAIVSAFKVLGRESAFLLIGGSVILSGIIAYVSVKFRLWNIFVRKEGEDRRDGFHSFRADLDQLVGKEGETATDLRPAGILLIEGKKYDAISEGGFLTKGTKVTVVTVSAGQLKVRQIK